VSVSDKRSPFDQNGRSALSDGAARFDALARELKSQQIAQCQDAPSTACSPPALSPDEEWAKNYMTQAIGPRLEMPRTTIFTPPPMPSVVFEFAPVEVIRPTPAAVGVEAPPAIGAQLGRPEPRRSWLGRLFRPKSHGAE